METIPFQRLRPTMEMIAQYLCDHGCTVQSRLHEPSRPLGSVRVYSKAAPARENLLYFLDHTPSEPVKGLHFAIGTRDCPNVPNCLTVPGKDPLALLNLVLNFFSLCLEWENRIDQVVYHNGSLNELCSLGAELLGNPVGIHDDWFILSAMSQDMTQVMTPDHLRSKGVNFIPKTILDDFQYDKEYAASLESHQAHFWDGGSDGSDSLYVNLWDGAVFRGRLLVMASNRPFRASDYPLAEALAQGAMLLLKKSKLDTTSRYEGMDETVYSLLQGQYQESTALVQLLYTLRWKRTDKFLCVQVKSQAAMTSVMDHMLHSDLFRTFPDAYILLSDHEQILVLNISQQPISSEMISYNLAPLCRDYGLYVGISAPVTGISELQYAYRQAELALNAAFQRRSDKWILFFSDCAMSHIFESIQSPLPIRHLIAPALQRLLDFDRDKGTQYLDTFRTYLQLERDIPKTASVLIIHRTTLQYRLNKIESLLGLNLEDPQIRLYLLLSLHLLKQEAG